jgi:hypothetical protein
MTGGRYFGWNDADCFCEIYKRDTPDGDPKGEAMLVHHFNQEHNIAKQPASSLHGERPDNVVSCTDFPLATSF